MEKKLPLILLIILISLFKASSVQAQTSCPTVPSNTGTVVFSTTTTAGTYRVWSRMKAADSTNNSFYLKIDNNCAVLVGDSSQISSTSLTWVDYQNGNASTKIDATLTAGAHVIILIGNEPGVSVDKVLLTKNLSCVPTGFGTNCPAELLTSSPTPTVFTITSNPQATNITATSANITWSLSEGATGQVEYGTTTSYGNLTTLEQSYNYTTHIQAVLNLSPNTTYHYRVKSLNKAGNEAISEDYTFKTLTSSSTPTPTITSTPAPTVAPTLTPTPSPTPVPTNTPPTVCTQDAKLCPDGSYVSRTAPNCAFAPCPPATPTPSPAVNATLISLNLKLHGIGKGGDNANPISVGNQNPIHTQKTISVSVFNSSNQLVSNKSGIITYQPSQGVFTGIIDMGNNLSSGVYSITLKTEKYLTKLIPIQNIISGQNNSLPQVALVVGDVNGDNKLNILDYNILISCYSEESPAISCSASEKQLSDLDDNGSVNQFDYNLFLRDFSAQSGD